MCVYVWDSWYLIFLEQCWNQFRPIRTRQWNQFWRNRYWTFLSRVDFLSADETKVREKRGWRCCTVWRNLMWIFWQWCSCFRGAFPNRMILCPVASALVWLFTVAPKLWRIRCQFSKCECFCDGLRHSFAFPHLAASCSAKTVISTVI